MIFFLRVSHVGPGFAERWFHDDGNPVWPAFFGAVRPSFSGLDVLKDQQAGFRRKAKFSRSGFEALDTNIRLFCDGISGELKECIVQVPVNDMEQIKRDAHPDGRGCGMCFELPMGSVRELISNAVCHRSYLSPGSIQVAIYDDRLEITSPGRLSPDLTIDQLIEGNSRVRNIAIGAAFQYMHIIER